ncbi:MAG: OprO/OprP family phosphate-selective porin [Gammaproteobacteria bacterium]|nr:OprO/OprP family phosphate-selective porin [Gammaproteobacteria bacterium]
MSFKLKPVTQHLLLAGFISLSPLAAQAADNDAEDRIKKLEQQVNILLQRLETQQVSLNEQKQVIEQNSKKTENAVIAKTNGRSLKFESADGDFVAQVGGRVQADAAFYDGDIPSGDGTDFRRIFLDLRGQVYKDWAYRFQYDFARPNGNTSTRGIRDAYIKYTGLDAGNITVGQFKSPFGLEHLTSSLHSTFLERGLNHVFTPDRRIGIGFDTKGDNWTFAVAGLGGTAEDEDNSSVNKDEGWNLVGRVTATPFKSDKGLLHIGLAARQNWAGDTDSTVRFRERPEVRVDGSRLIDTGSISNVDEQRSYGVELAGVYGPFSLQAEYTTTDIERDTGSDLDFDSWYAYASYFLTGESRTYKNGIFDRTKVKKAVGKGGYGAWEVAARYSTADLTDGTVIGGELDNATFGVNWYATNNVRFAANYIKVLDIDRPSNALDGKDGDIFAARAQIDF